MATCFLDCASANLRVRGDEHLENVRTPHKPHARAPSPQPPPNTPNIIQDESAGAGGVDGEKSSAAASSSPPAPGGDRQLMAVCTDKGAVVYALPSHRVIYNQARTRFNSIESQLTFQRVFIVVWDTL